MNLHFDAAFFSMPGTIQPLGGEIGCDGLERGGSVPIPHCFICFPSQGLRSSVEDLVSNRSRDIYIYMYIYIYIKRRLLFEKSHVSSNSLLL